MKTGLPYLTHIERTMFCRKGKLPGHVRSVALKDPLVPVLLYEAHCPCGENDPNWILIARALSLKQKARPFFPNLFSRYGVQEYNAAMEALIAYRKVKDFHFTWGALQKAAQDAYLALDQNGLKLVVELSETGWKDFMVQLSSEVVGHLKGKVEGEVQDYAKSKMSKRGQLRFVKALAYLDRIGMLNEIWKDIKAKELAKKRHDHPEVVDYKLRFFMGLMAKGEGYLKLYNRYWEYDKVYWRLLQYSLREKELRSIQKRSSSSWNPVSKGISSVPFPADQGLF